MLFDSQYNERNAVGFSLLFYAAMPFSLNKFFILTLSRTFFPKQVSCNAYSILFLQVLFIRIIRFYDKVMYAYNVVRISICFVPWLTNNLSS
jgi:hypothetical protein